VLGAAIKPQIFLKVGNAIVFIEAVILGFGLVDWNVISTAWRQSSCYGERKSMLATLMSIEPVDLLLCNYLCTHKS